MFKKIILLFSFSLYFVTSYTDDLATTFMLMNNYNARQLVDIWARMRAGFRLSHTETSRVKYYEQLYTKNPKAFTKKLAAAKPYLYYILNEVERFGIPSEVALLAGVESFYNPHARSKSNAYGMWQFLPGTGQRFNLAQNSDIDERQDIVKSTDAALRYLMYLHSLFGQWELAIGAYNSGEGNMYKVVYNSGQKRGSVVYDDLNLREETQNYVPKLIALANIIENPKRFGVTLDDVPNEPYFAMTSPVAETTLNTVAKLSGVDNKVFTKLNPQYKNDSYRLGTQHKVLLPITNQNIYYASLNKTDTISDVNSIQLANQNSLPASSDISNIKQANLDNNAETLAVADDIDNILNKQQSEQSGVSDLVLNARVTADTVPTSGHKLAHSRAELDDILDNINTTDDNDGITKKSGVITASSMLEVNKDNAVKYTVGSGDTLYSIAKRFNANIDDIRTDNKIPGNNLSSGQVLQIRQTSVPISTKTSS